MEFECLRGGEVGHVGRVLLEFVVLLIVIFLFVVVVLCEDSGDAEVGEEERREFVYHEH